MGPTPNRPTRQVNRRQESCSSISVSASYQCATRRRDYITPIFFGAKQSPRVQIRHCRTVSRAERDCVTDLAGCYRADRVLLPSRFGCRYSGMWRRFVAGCTRSGSRPVCTCNVYTSHPFHNLMHAVISVIIYSSVVYCGSENGTPVIMSNNFFWYTKFTESSDFR